MSRSMRLAILLGVASILAGGDHSALTSPDPQRPSDASPRAERGRTLNLSAPRLLDPVYHGASRSLSAMKEGRMQARALATADFDEDGMPDLLVAHTSPDGNGALALHRGNADAVYPNQPEARRRRADGTFTDAPFLRDVAVFDAAEA